MPTHAEQLAEISAYFDRDDAAFSKIATAFPGVVADNKFLKDKIAQLESTINNPTPEVQAILDQMKARANAAATRNETLAADIKALDDATVPEVPPPTPEPTPTPTPGPTPPPPDTLGRRR